MISPEILKRVFFGFNNDPLKSRVTFALLYSPYLDRTLTLKYWGNYHELFHRELFGGGISYVLKFDSEAKFRPSGIIDFCNSSPSIINDSEIKKILGIYLSPSNTLLPYRRYKLFVIQYINFFHSVGMYYLNVRD